MSAEPDDLDRAERDLGERLLASSGRVANLEREREFLIAHARNLDAVIRRLEREKAEVEKRLGEESARIRELEAALRHAREICHELASRPEPA